jgi:hypothetical protein
MPLRRVAHRVARAEIRDFRRFKTHLSPTAPTKLDQAPTDPDQMSRDQLRDALRARGLSASGDKAKLLERFKSSEQ